MLYLILALILALITATFAFQNTIPVTLHLLKWEFHGSLALVSLVIFAVGFFANFLISLASAIRYRWIIYHQNKKINDLKDELEDREKKPVFDHSVHRDS